MSSTTRQKLQALKEENLKLHDNLEKFFKQQHEESKTFVIIKKNDVQEFLEEQETMIKNFNQRIESQDLMKENLKLIENLKKFFKQQHEESKTFVIIKKNGVQELLEERETLIKNFNQCIDNITTNVIDEHLVSSLFTFGQNVNKRRLTSDENENHSRPSKKPCMEPRNIIQSHLEDFINIPGLQHLAENIFLNLYTEKLEDCCRLINEAAKKLLDDPTFWIKKFIRRGLSKENQTKWIKAIQMTKNTHFEESILFYLKESSENDRLVNLPCYIDKDMLAKYSALLQSFSLEHFGRKHFQLFKIIVRNHHLVSSETRGTYLIPK